MEYLQQLRKFYSSHYLYAGIRLTAAVLIPALILYHFGLLAPLMTIPLGALCVGLTDNPGPYHHKKNSLIASIIFNFFVALISGYAHVYIALVFLEIIVFGMFFSLIGVYGNRVSSIGLIALLVFVFNIDGHTSSGHILYSALWFSAGGAWYTILSLLSYRIRPYKLIQQLLGECLTETSDYLQIKADFYLADADFFSLNNNLMKSQVLIQQHQEDLREILFKTRQIVTESTAKGRVLMLIFLDSIDLSERIMTSQQDYEQLHKEFDDSGILNNYFQLIATLANELHAVGLAVQSGVSSKSQTDVGDALNNLEIAFAELRKKFLSPDTIEGLIKLRQVLNNLGDITERIERLKSLTTYDKNLSRQYKRQVDLEQFISHKEIDPKLLIENLSLQSGYFRHAVRLTLALLIGYTVSLLFPFGHSYWVLLTITLIIKPSYSITKKRNSNRLIGTLIGAATGFIILYLTKDKTILFVFMLLAMMISYSMLKINYLISVIGITLYVLLSFYFLNPNGFQHTLDDRIIDTVTGSLIAIIISATVLPLWEHEQTGDYILKALEANRLYFKTVAEMFAQQNADITVFKLARKNAFVSLANLSGNFQRMLSEPKSKQPKMEEYHQFVATSHTLTSYIASLSYYAQTKAANFANINFEPLIKEVDEQFQHAINIYQHQPNISISNQSFINPVKAKVTELLELRKQELLSGNGAETPVRKTLSDLKTISDQFDLINAIVMDENKILQRILV